MSMAEKLLARLEKTASTEPGLLDVLQRKSHRGLDATFEFLKNKRNLGILAGGVGLGAIGMYIWHRRNQKRKR